MRRVLLVMVICLSASASASAQAADPAPTDFAYGLPMQPQAGKPVQTLRVPDAVYAHVTRADLGDIRIFNADDVAVPYALCPVGDLATQRRRRQNLPVFALRRASADGNSGSRVRIETAQGTRIQVLEPVTPETDNAGGDIGAYVIDARGVSGRIRAIQPQWQSAGGPSELQVRLQASNDLEHWRTIVANATLLRARGETGALTRSRIALPDGEYAYLRLEPSDATRPPRIQQVIADVQSRMTEAAAVMVDAEATGRGSGEAVFRFDSRRSAPMQAAHVSLPASNMALGIALDSRAQDGAEWRQRWRGEVYELDGMKRPDGWTPIRFAPTRDRYWRLRVVRGAASLAGAKLGLRLEYQPRRLRFLAQGEAPFVLAYGSAAAAPGARDCDRLLSGLARNERERMTGDAVPAGPAVSLGGDAALTAAPEPVPVRRYLLWAVLVAGVLLLAGLALALLRRVGDH